MRIETLPAGPIETNAYLLTSDSGESLLVDAPPQVEPAVRNALKRSNSRLVAVLVTHGHWDHIGDLAAMSRGDVMVFAHPGDKTWIENPEIMAAYMVPGLTVAPARVDRWVADGDRLNLAGAEIRIRHVPGHAPGNVLFYFPSLDAAFVGDALFHGGVGRFDLPGGDWNSLERSIRNQIYTLPDRTAVYSGHGPATTVGAEKKNNPFVRGGEGE